MQNSEKRALCSILHCRLQTPFWQPAMRCRRSLHARSRNRRVAVDDPALIRFRVDPRPPVTALAVPPCECRPGDSCNHPVSRSGHVILRPASSRTPLPFRDARAGCSNAGGVLAPALLLHVRQFARQSIHRMSSHANRLSSEAPGPSSRLITDSVDDACARRHSVAPCHVIAHASPRRCSWQPSAGLPRRPMATGRGSAATRVALHPIMRTSPTSGGCRTMWCGGWTCPAGPGAPRSSGAITSSS
jgi:hypothetical protein